MCRLSSSLTSEPTNYDSPTTTPLQTPRKAVDGSPLENQLRPFSCPCQESRSTCRKSTMTVQTAWERVGKLSSAPVTFSRSSRRPSLDARSQKSKSLASACPYSAVWLAKTACCLQKAATSPPNLYPIVSRHYTHGYQQGFDLSTCGKVRSR